MNNNSRTLFGVMPDGTKVEQVTLRNGGIECEIITYGGAVRSLKVPDRNGNKLDVILGMDDLEGYRKQDKFFGALIGRYANRIGNARFTLGGKDYPLAANDGINHLHGGVTGFDKRVWNIKSFTENTLELSLFSPDGEEGYPGNLSVNVVYRLTADSLDISYKAECDSDTVCNLTNHSYFNLSGHKSGPVDKQYIQINAQSYTPTDTGSIPTGEIAPVEGTPMDLRAGVKIGEHVEDAFEQLEYAGGYDHNWVLDGASGTLRPVAKAWSEETGITLEVLTTLPGIQFYSGNYLDGCPAGKDGAPYAKRWGFCLETQDFPDSPNKKVFPSTVLHKSEQYVQNTVYRFGSNA